MLGLQNINIDFMKKHIFLVEEIDLSLQNSVIFAHEWGPLK